MCVLDASKLLRKTGFVPLRLQDRLVSSAARRALSILGEQSVVALIYHMMTLTGLKERELLSNYAEFEKALWSSLGYGAEIMLKRFGEEFTRYTHGKGIGFGDMLDEVRRNEHTVFARSISQGENAALLYTSPSFRDRVVSAFFEPIEGGGVMAALVDGHSSLPPSVARATYSELKGRHGTFALEGRVAEWTSAVRPEGTALRLAKDNTWLLENGLNEPSHDSVGQRKTALLCAYDLTRMDEASAAKAAELHDLVVVEGLQSIYARG